VKFRGPKGETFELQRVADLADPMPRTLAEMREPDDDDAAAWLAAHPGWSRA
jgi:hypothetical protein